MDLVHTEHVIDRRSRHAVSTWLFLRVLGVVYILAFWSLASQWLGLVGEGGILPARITMAGARAFVATEHIGVDRFRLLPTLFWLNSSDVFLNAMCFEGMGLAALLVAGIAPVPVLTLLWIDYLSLSVVGREFLSFQWDALLLETGLLAIVVAPLVLRERLAAAIEPPRVARWLMLWLLFRLMVGSGAVKLASGDQKWRSLTALSVHFETQPIPTTIAWHVHRLPLGATRAITAVVLAIELVAPFLMFGPRRARHVGCALLVGLQIVIALTGNYAFFNLLTIALCIWLLDDETLEHAGLKGPRYAHEERADLNDARSMHDVARPSWGRVRSSLSIVIAVLTVPVSLLLFTSSIGIPMPAANVVVPIADAIEPLRIVNSYGLFAVMTPTRPEIIVEGSNDGQNWLAYEFKYKPGDLQRRPPWVAPHQPRLDWQMWFAALGGLEQSPWFKNFCVRLLQGSPEVLRLLDRNPFPDRPPRYVRGVLYRYRFSGDAWWTRESLGQYSPPISLSDRPQQ